MRRATAVLVLLLLLLVFAPLPAQAETWSTDDHSRCYEVALGASYAVHSDSYSGGTSRRHLVYEDRTVYFHDTECWTTVKFQRYYVAKRAWLTVGTKTTFYG